MPIPNPEVPASSLPAPRAIDVTTLRRTAEPEQAAASAVRRLVQVVAEWQPASLLRITLTGATETNGALFRLEQRGAAQPTWEADLAWAIGELCVLPPAVAVEGCPVPSRVTELVPARDGFSVLPRVPTWEELSDDEPSPRRPSFAGHDGRDRRVTPPWPRGYFDDLSGIVATLAHDPLSVLSFVVAPAEPLETELLAASMAPTWGGSEEGLARYLGQPVRVRVLVGSGPEGPSARLSAQLKQLAQPLRLRRLDESAADEAWAGGPDSLVGHAVPEALAGSLLRVPAAGKDGFPGFVTAHPEFQMRALDPMPPAPPTPLQLGYAMSATGHEEPFCIDELDLPRHLFFEGASGTGKSTAEATLVLRLMEQGIGFTVLDPHGSLVDSILRLIPGGEAQRRLRVVRHGDREHPVPLNPFAGDERRFQRALEAFIEMVQQWLDPKHEGMVGPRWRRWFTLVVQACRVLWGDRVSIPLAVSVASDMSRVGQLADRIKADAPELADRLRNEYGDLSGKEATDVTSWAVSKLNPFVSSEAMRGILDRGASAIDVAELMDERGGLLVDLASPDLGEGSSRILGALWLQEHLLALGDRADRTKPHVIVVDEAHLFTFGALPRLLAEARKFGVCIVIATQTVAALPDRLADGIESNSGGFFAFRAGLRNAFRAAQRLEDWPVGELVRLPDLHAAATVSRDGVMTEPFTLRLDRIDALRPSGVTVDDLERAAAEVEEASRLRLSEPYRDLHPHTDEEVQRRLARPPRRPPISVDEDTTPRQSPTPSAVDDWLERHESRLKRQVAAARTDAPTN